MTTNGPKRTLYSDLNSAKEALNLLRQLNTNGNGTIHAVLRKNANGCSVEAVSCQKSYSVGALTQASSRHDCRKNA